MQKTAAKPKPRRFTDAYLDKLKPPPPDAPTKQISFF
jgi:hypothetical protein